MAGYGLIGIYCISLGTPDFLGVTRVLSMYPGLASYSAGIGRSLLILVVIDGLTMSDLSRYRLECLDPRLTTIVINADFGFVRRTRTRPCKSIVDRMYMFTTRICLGMVVLNLTLR